MREKSKRKRKISKSTIRVLVFAGLTLLTLGIVVHFTFSKETVSALRSFHPLYLLVLFGIWMVSFGLDAASFGFYTRGTDERLKFGAAIRAAAFRVFFNLITPFGFGGQPFVIYFLQREGVPPGKGSSIVLIKLIVVSSYVFFGAIAGFVFFHTHIENAEVLNVFFYATAAIQVAFIALIVAGILRPRIVIRLLTALGRLGHRFGIVKNPGRFRHQLVHEVYLAKSSFKRYFRQHLFSFFMGTLCIGVIYTVEVITLWVIFLGLGVRLPFSTGIALGSLFLFLLSFLPTPGAAGLGEGAFVVLFSSVVPYYLLGVAVILWRLFYNYLTSILGAIFSSRHFSRLIIGPSED
ncbi:MAG TPA: lysylphosphatidylglycerol synthase transmembrane domain-containing protein [Spirochaetia bacterium]|nr:lysylphosphatidylglycerol synthase transmembrane domain-containing protein [Spirochaetia bacterium]